jgi:putative heme-binding domain-containing protein
VAPLLSHVVQSDFVPDRSSFQTKDTGHPITTDDPWFRPVDIQVGPDGAIYVADFYEQRIDHASHYQGRVHAESGRIYRLRTAGEIKRGPSPNLGVLTSRDLVEQLKHPNKWRRQTALRLLADRRDSSLIEPLKSMIRESTDQLALEFFWALRAAGGLDESFARETLEHADPYVRAWTVRLLCDDRAVSDQVAKQLAELAYREPHVEVRSQLACSARRLPAKECLRIVANLLRHDEDAGDIHLPLLLWWALENKVAHADQVVQLFEDKTLWDRPLVREHLLERLVRRFAASGKRSDLLACAKLFEISPSAEHGKRLLAGFETAFEGRSMRGLPAELVEALGKVGGGSLALRVRQGDAAAATEALAIVRNEKAKPRDRVLYIDIAGQIKLKDADLLLLEIVETSKNAEVRQAALHALQSFDNPLIGKRVVELLNKLPKPTQEAAFALLSSRDVWSLHLLAAIEGGTLAVDKTPLPVVRRMLLHPNDRTQELIKKHWGDVQGAATAEMKRDIRRFGELLGQGSGNPYNGKKLFANSCGKCHILFKQGGKIGPDLTAYKRDDLQGMLVNVVNPSIEIREGYENFAIYTLDGRALNGFIEEQDPQVVVLKSVEGQKTVIPRDDIDEMQALPRSIMPEGLLKLYSEQQVRDLFAYLRASQPLP